MPYYGGKFKE
ncbi:hypothetical protein TSAR_002156 [Trichomalopsis sarcophagae]|uniref:Uncharacterized protein n=1 Tax=Trichomalopsis sarcophagae TaxID=543379 RepID=A0A232FBW9_9HYME|nr:hypothetical protein TSAR_002156 [Trichomalopsis sarcophagae]